MGAAGEPTFLIGYVGTDLEQRQVQPSALATPTDCLAIGCGYEPPINRKWPNATLPTTIKAGHCLDRSPGPAVLALAGQFGGAAGDWGDERVFAPGG
jgi:hypothetical protein